MTKLLADEQGEEERSGAKRAGRGEERGKEEWPEPSEPRRPILAFPRS